MKKDANSNALADRADNSRVAGGQAAECHHVARRGKERPILKPATPDFLRRNEVLVEIYRLATAD